MPRLTGQQAQLQVFWVEGFWVKGWGLGVGGWGLGKNFVPYSFALDIYRIEGVEVRLAVFGSKPKTFINAVCMAGFIECLFKWSLTLLAQGNFRATTTLALFETPRTNRRLRY